MRRVRLRQAAEESLIDIYLHSLEFFGVQQADRYQQGLANVASLIAEQPSMGHPSDEIVPGSRRHVWKAHVIYYMVEDEGIWIIDILGAGRDPIRALWSPSDGEEG